MSGSLRNLFKNPFLKEDLNVFLQKKNVSQTLSKLKMKMKRKLKKQEAHQKKRNLDDLKKKRLRTLGILPGGDKKKDDNNMKFNFLPGFAGMPFPPFMMNGPHFHPPIDVTVNSIPNPNPKADLNPFEIENANLQT